MVAHHVCVSGLHCNGQLVQGVTHISSNGAGNWHQPPRSSKAKQAWKIDLLA